MNTTSSTDLQNKLDKMNELFAELNNNSNPFLISLLSSLVQGPINLLNEAASKSNNLNSCKFGNPDEFNSAVLKIIDESLRNLCSSDPSQKLELKQPTQIQIHGTMPLDDPRHVQNILRHAKLKENWEKYGAQNSCNLIMDEPYNTTLSWDSLILVSHYLSVFFKYYDKNVNFTKSESEVIVGVVVCFKTESFPDIMAVVKVNEKLEEVKVSDLTLIDPIANEDPDCNDGLDILEIMSGNNISTYIIMMFLIKDGIKVSNLITSDLFKYPFLPREFFLNIIPSYEHIDGDALTVTNKNSAGKFSLMICPPPNGDHVTKKKSKTTSIGGACYQTLKNIPCGGIIAVVGELGGADGVSGLLGYILKYFEILMTIAVEEKYMMLDCCQRRLWIIKKK